MAQLEPYRNEITKAGDLVYVAAEKKDGFWKPAKHLAEHPISYPFLLDEDRSVTKVYGLYHALGTDAFRIAHPASLVVDRAGMVRYIYRGENQQDRAPFEQVLNAINKL